MFIVPSQLCLKLGTNIKKMGWLKEGKHERHKSVRIENSKQYALKIENVQTNETIIVCGQLDESDIQ